jgi:hypothetical protein
MYDKDSLYGGDGHLKYHVLFYDHGEWRFEYTGYDDAESYDQLNTILGVDEDDLRCYYRVIGDRTGGPWEGYWQDGQGFTNPAKLGAGEVSMGAPHSYCWQALRARDGARITLWQDTNDNAHRKYWLLRDADTGFTAYNLSELSLDPPFEANQAQGLYEGKRGVGVFLSLYDQVHTHRLEHWLLSQGQWIADNPLVSYLDVQYPPKFVSVTAGPSGEPIAIFSDSYTDEGDFRSTCFIAERVDPRDAD